jgi:hypothetical protein
MDKFSEIIKEDLESLWINELRKIDQLPQRQDSTNEQMVDLYTIANKFGLYDAADYIRENFM